MAEKKRYIAQYRMPVGFDNPPLNLPNANTPEVVRLTDAEAEQVKQMLPDIKLVRAKEQDEEEDLSPQAQLAAAEADGKEEAPEEEEASSEEEEESEEESAEKEAAEAESEEEAEEKAEVSETSLDNDQEFPGLEHLKQAGMKTVQDVIAYMEDGDLSDIDGIGNARKEKISDYLAENYSDLLNE